MRIVFLGSGGEYSARVLDGLAAEHRVVYALLPPMPRSWLRRLMTWRLSAHLRHVASRRGVATRRVTGSDLEAMLRELAPDLLCVATFPRILPPSTLAIPPLGSLNVHPSLLPRHRGADPVFWVFRDDERESGVTVHWVNEGVDTGDLVAQRSVALDDGIRSVELNARLGDEGGRLLAQAVTAIAAGNARREPQDEERATHDSLPRRSDYVIPFEKWRVDRVWRFLRGVGTRLLHDRDGRSVKVGGAGQCVIGQHAMKPGTFSDGRLYCIDGWITFAPVPLRRRLAAILFQST